MKNNRIVSLLFSTRTMTFLLLAFAASMAAGTIIESYYDTPTSKKWIYNTWWFSAMMLLLMLNFIGNIKRYQLLQWKKWSILTLHLSWVLIIIGAGITRYISFEGIMLLREGETSNEFYSEETYMSFIIQGKNPNTGEEMQREVHDKMLITPYDYDYSNTESFYNKEISIHIDTLIYDAVEGLIPTEDATERYLKIVEAGQGERHDHLLKDGEKVSIHGALFGVNIDPEVARKEGIINIIENWNGYQLQTPYEGEFMRMADQMKGQVYQDSIQPLQLRSLYTIGERQFVIPEPIQAGRVGVIKAPEPTAAKAYGVFATLTSGDESKQIEIIGGKGIISEYEKININDMTVYVKYGSILRELPFSLTLNDFIATKQPGTEKSYAAFESQVTVNDDEGSVEERIYMNHVLDKEGYRFFQASFDPDELGSHLSVNHDFWGKTVTYAGYYLLYLGLLALLFDPNTRFGELRKGLQRLEKRKMKNTIASIALLLISSLGFAQEVHDNHEHEKEVTSTQEQSVIPTQIQWNTKEVLDSIFVANLIPQKEAAKFGKVVIQDNGRMKPASTLASEFLRKVSEREYYPAVVDGKEIKLTPEQTMLSMMQFGRLWYEVPLIKLNYKNDSINKVLGVGPDVSYVSSLDFFRDKDGNFTGFKIAPYLDDANTAETKNVFQKDYLDLYRSLGILDQMITSEMIKVYPLPNDDNNKWVSFPEAQTAGFKGVDSVLTSQLLPAYLQTLRYGRDTGDFTKADEILATLEKFQRTRGEAVMPSKEKIEAEIFYNKYDIFKTLYKWYGWFGILMLILLVVEIIKPMREIRWAIVFHKYVLFLCFVAHLIGLGIRWYLSGHAPWSDAYESLIYVAWAVMLFGLLFGRKSEMTIAGAGFVVAIILWVAHLNWLDPQIANLQPVLDSYWLMIHVAVIVGSYGPFALGAILGLITFILMIILKDDNKKNIDLKIKELTYINEVSLTVGLIMLTIGNFLGGMWANESWGRYWGWDPKETWALITIFIYAFVLHLRLVPGLKSRWTFALWSIISFFSVLMTYFGVNFYLTGLHSYASGEKVVTYQGAGIALAIILVIGYVARFRESKIFGRLK